MTDILSTAKREHASFGRYVAVGVLSFTANLALAFTFHEIVGWSENAAVGLSLTTVFILNFVLAKTFIYRDDGRWQRQFVRFGAISALARLGEFGLFFLLNTVGGINYLLALVAAQGVSFMAKFFLYGKFAFNTASSTGRAERDRALFDRIAERYHRKDLAPASRTARKLRLEQTLSLVDVRAEAVLMEAGCGAGFAATYLKGAYGSYLGVDHSADLVAYACAHNGGPNAKFRVGDVMNFEADTKFDVVFMIGLLHHMEDPAAALTALARVVTPGGWIVANEPQSGNPLISVARIVRKRIDSRYSEEQIEFSRSQLRSVFEQAGLTEIRIRPQGVFSTPLAEITLPLQRVTAPLSRLCCAADRALESAVPGLLLPVAWNLIAAGRVPADSSAASKAAGRTGRGRTCAVSRPDGRIRSASPVSRADR